jgi:hypothetical protein
MSSREYKKVKCIDDHNINYDPVGECHKKIELTRSTQQKCIIQQCNNCVSDYLDKLCKKCCKKC